MKNIINILLLSIVSLSGVSFAAFEFKEGALQEQITGGQEINPAALAVEPDLVGLTEVAALATIDLTTHALHNLQAIIRYRMDFLNETIVNILLTLPNGFWGTLVAGAQNGGPESEGLALRVRLFIKFLFLSGLRLESDLTEGRNVQMYFENLLGLEMASMIITAFYQAPGFQFASPLLHCIDNDQSLTAELIEKYNGSFNLKERRSKRILDSSDECWGCWSSFNEQDVYYEGDRNPGESYAGSFESAKSLLLQKLKEDSLVAFLNFQAIVRSRIVRGEPVEVVFSDIVKNYFNNDFFEWLIGGYHEHITMASFAQFWFDVGLRVDVELPYGFTLYTLLMTVLLGIDMKEPIQAFIAELRRLEQEERIYLSINGASLDFRELLQFFEEQAVLNKPSTIFHK